MKVFLSIALVLLLIMVAANYWLNRERFAERRRMENASEIYKKREAALLKSRAKAMDAITKIIPSHGAGLPTPAASATPGAAVEKAPAVTPVPDATAPGR